MEISIINKCDLERTIRIDSEYYKPHFLDIQEKLSKLKGILPLTKICKVSDGNHMSIAEYFDVDNGIPYYRGKDLTDFFLDNTDPVFIPVEIFNTPQMKRSHFKKGDVLISIVGTIGNLSIVTKNTKEATGSCKIAILRPLNISSSYLAVFLMCKYGNEQIKRNVRGAVQTGIILEDFDQIYIPSVSEEFQNLISNMINTALDINTRSQKLYVSAENIILTELNLDEWKPIHKLSFTKNYSTTNLAGRIDAEYYQPMYDEIEKKILKYKNGTELIKNQFNQNKKSFKIDLNQEYNYVEIGCVSTSDGSITPIKISGDELPANAKIKLYKNDVVVSKVRPYRGAIGIINNNNFIGSGAFTVLQENGKVNKETLFVYLRTKPMLQYSLKYNTGTSYPTIIDDDILNYQIPLFDNSIQKKVKEKIEEAINTKVTSKRLLDMAKCGVEKVIEENEAEAERWINEEVEKLGVTITNS